MTRPLQALGADADVFAALRAALSGGPAILPLAPGEHRGDRADLPAEVEQKVALVVQTSGSTGRPKRVALSADAILANAGASQAALGGPGQWILALPTHYIAGLNVLSRSLAAGTEPVIVPGEHFTADGFVAATRELSIPERFVALVPAQLTTLLDDRAALAELRRFQRVLVGGQATPRALLERAEDAGVAVSRSYGSSETSGGCVYDGVPIGTTQVRIVDGEVQLGGPSLAEGYLGDAELTADRFVVDEGMRWYRTSDGGRLENVVPDAAADAGAPAVERLVVTGRLDDVIISGGVKVALAAVERTLRELPGLVDAVVVAADDPRWGEAPVAFTAAPADRVDDAALAEAIAEVGRRLGPASRPRAIVRRASLPLLASGKPDRPALRREAAAL
ncbi:AMP-binding protein [Schumannella sp. 10F1B-5-1]|uniref:AMP-binding protein n=1 Tax=Schumannella sp. 10F1B-5-1 TaxID=2590780 RepID=UPI00112FEB65|nr:AMP-binding protein [Schumannella sp. 10F1B-5-1]TPW71534.1 AMP-binding protein [Schumannella sp. 10F1B-5-1]